MKIKIWTAGFFALCITYLLWPLSSDNYDIEFSQEKYKQKKDYLAHHINKSNNDLPNIIWIVADDLGVADVSLYGHQKISTPNIDRLGIGGVTFTNAFTTSPVCSPARAALLTGKYPQRFGFQYQMHDRYLKNRLEYLGFKYFIDSAPWEPKWMNEVPSMNAIQQQGIPPSEIIIPELLKTKGYQTALIGKWHLGNSPEQLPCNMGFDYQFGFYASHSLYAPEGTAGITDQKIDKDFTDQYIWEGQRNGPHAIYQNCEEIEVEEYLTDRFTAEAIQYIQSAKENPFFLLLSYNAPHTPLQAPTAIVEQFSHIKDPIERVYYAMIKNLDDNIGMLLGYLDEEDLLENTVLFFVSDNGGAEYTFATDNGPYIGGKITDFEGGIRIPMTMQWKGKIPSNITYNNQVSLLDLFKTTCSIANIELPIKGKYDGVNLLNYVLDENKEEPHPYLFWQRGPSKAVRTRQWKILWNEEFQDTLFYNLQDSPYESIDVLSEHREEVEKLTSIHRYWSNDFPPPLWPSMIYFKYPFDSKIFYFDQ